MANAIGIRKRKAFNNVIEKYFFLAFLVGVGDLDLSGVGDLEPMLLIKKKIKLNGMYRM